jgi:hypothetical protein
MIDYANAYCLNQITRLSHWIYPPLSILELAAFAVEGGIYESNRIYKRRGAVKSFSKVF